jgi:hypothetical protein
MENLRKPFAGALVAAALLGGSLATPALASNNATSQSGNSSALAQPNAICYYEYWVPGYWYYDAWGNAYWSPGYWAYSYYYC